MKVVITGVSGYIGSTICLMANGWEIVGIDIKEPSEDVARKIDFVKMDVRDKGIKKVIDGADVVIHLAFVLNPPDDRAVARSINIGGTENVLDACAKAGVKQVIVLTSATAYGAHPDNPIPIPEDFPIRGDLNRGFWYSEDKAVQDRLTQKFAKENPNIKVCIVRPVIVFGERVENYIAEGFFKPPMVSILTRNIPFQFIHELDTARAIVLMVEKEVDGPFNLAGRGIVTLKDAAKIMKKPAVKIPEPLQIPLVNLMRKLGLVDRRVPNAILDFFRYPWVVDTTRAFEVLGFEPEFTSEGAFEIAWRSWKKRHSVNRVT